METNSSFIEILEEHEEKPTMTTKKQSLHARLVAEVPVLVGRKAKPIKVR